MESQKMIRKLFQILAIILFIFQIKQSVRKYFLYPVVVQTSNVAVEDLPKPVVYICQADQFNQTKSKSLGYEYMSHFLAGILNGTNTTSWNGKDGNLTYKELESIVFDHDYTKLQLTGDYGNSKEYILILPYGICLKLSDSKSNLTIWLRTKSKVHLILADPYKTNGIWTDKFSDAKMTVGPSNEHFYERAIYEIDYTVHDESIHDGKTCTDNIKTKLSYQKCINAKAKNEFQTWYGCLPPWFPVNQSEKMCQSEMPRKKITLESPIIQSLYELLDNREVKMFKKCLPPCITMKIKVEKTRYDRNRLNQASLKAFSKDWAVKHTKVYSYDEFDFVVDFGSALGLWLGLSCLSILDNILETLMSLKTYWKK